MTGRDVTNYTMTDELPASSEDRTRDLALTKRMLCQLSYRGLPARAPHFLLGFARVGRLLPTVRPEPCVHSTRVVFNPSKVKIRVRVPMNARLAYAAIV